MIWLAVGACQEVVIHAAHWHTAVHHLAARWGVAPESIKTTILDHDSTECFQNSPRIELRWVGDDFNHGGSRIARRLEVREKENVWADWGPWKESRLAAV